MLEKIFQGSKTYWAWVGLLVLLVVAGLAAYINQLNQGLTVTGLSRDVSWGLYIGQFTFLVGVAASAVMLVLPYYLHNVKEFGRITVFGEFLAVAAVVMCLLFIIVDLGRPMRLLNMILYPSPNSVMFWDMVVLSGYLVLNLIIAWNVMEAERKAVNPPRWVKTLIYISIPWAVSIHTVTAFLYAGLPGREYWLTAIMAVRFLASAFAAGPALLILLLLAVKRFNGFDAGRAALEKLAVIVTYAMVISVFLVILEIFTAFYSGIPGHAESLAYLFWGLEGHNNFVPLMWIFAALALLSLVLLLNPAGRKNSPTLAVACGAVFLSLWIEKGLTLVVGGFVPNSLNQVAEYLPTGQEIMIAIGVWALGFLLLTALYKIVLSVKHEAGADAPTNETLRI